MSFDGVTRAGCRVSHAEDGYREKVLPVTLNPASRPAFTEREMRGQPLNVENYYTNFVANFYFQGLTPVPSLFWHIWP
jgi:hypothetical protein